MRLIAVIVTMLMGANSALADSEQLNKFNDKEEKPRVVVLTDIGRPDLEPDDTESLVRLLCYADQLEIEGIITSTGWNCDPYPTESAAYRDAVVSAYGYDIKNLMKRSKQTNFNNLEEENGKQAIGYWPSVEYLKSRCVMGSQHAGIGVIGKHNNTAGSDLIIRLADEDDDRPLWVCAWGGANTLAQAIWKVKTTRSAKELKQFLNKIRLYTITDQDMVYAMRENLAYSSHQWMRREFKDDLKFVWDEGTWQLQCELGKEYWAEFQKNIQGHAALGKQYPDYKWGVEGDTPSFLNVIPNGLHDPEFPNQIGWGGYHVWSMSKDQKTYAWNSWIEPIKSISESNYRRFFPDQLNDFIARLEWAEKGTGNRNPIIVINGNKGTDAIHIKTHPGENILLDASKSSDPDGDSLSFEWWQPDELGNIKVSIEDTNRDKVRIKVPNLSVKDKFHFICEVHDSGSHHLVAYRRVIVEVE